MEDLYIKMLQKSIDKQAKKIISEGATEQERYGHLLDSINGRDLDQEERDRRQEAISRLHSNAEAGRIRREKEAKESKRKLQSIVNNAAHNAQNEDRKNADAFLEKYKERLDKAHENIRKEQSKYYFS